MTTAWQACASIEKYVDALTTGGKRLACFCI
jgi:hypothetical protein